MDDVSLDALGLKFGTDKASSGHDYLSFYETFFRPIRHSVKRILEIGVWQGQSLRVWNEYFPNAEVVGVDINPLAKELEDGRIKIEILDQGNIQNLTELGMKYGVFDIIVEDGSHLWEHQITTLRSLFPFLSKNGHYIVEDLQTNYGSMVANYKGRSSITCVDYLKSWLDLRVADELLEIDNVEDPFLRTYGRSVAFMAFCRHGCLIQKKWRAINVNCDSLVLDDDIHSISSSVKILAHLTNVGDIKSASGSVRSGDAGKPYAIQGLSLTSKSGALQYKIRQQNGTWTEWVAEGVFAGSRGMAKELTGFAVRLDPTLRVGLEVRLVCGFVGEPEPIAAVEGKECISPQSHALCALQVDVYTV